MSSDSPFFDRYHHFATVGACERLTSPYRVVVHFHASVGARARAGARRTYYEAGSASTRSRVLNKTHAGVRTTSSRARQRRAHWLDAGADGLAARRDGRRVVPGRLLARRSAQRVKATEPDALIIGELWQKDSTPAAHPARRPADTTMNYRLRDAVLGLLAPQAFDCKGFPDSGHADLAVASSRTGSTSIREDYPDAAYYSLMNLLDSHDTERLLWTLTPGAENRAARGGQRREPGRGQAPPAARLADPVRRCRARRRSTTATRSA